MMRSMSVYITTARQVKGAAWSARYPDRATDLFVVAQIGGKKKRKQIGPDTPENRERAERKRDEWQAILERRELQAAGLMAPTLSEAIADFVAHGMRGRAPKTISGRRYQLDKMAQEIGSQTAIDRIDSDTIALWWDGHVDGKRDIRTGKGYLNALSMLYRHAIRQDPKLANPVPAARDRILGEIERTASYRARDAANCDPLSTQEIARLLPAIERGGNPDLLLTIALLLDAGLRLTEATGLQWGDVWWGQDESDVSRHIHVQRRRSGRTEGHTKSGRSRRVALSRRLRQLLLERHMELGRPEPEAWIVGQSWEENIRSRLDRACRAAKIRRRRPKDLRDTYASTLITHGIVLKWISLQLGHGSIAVTERHYASYMALDRYQNPWQVPQGSLPPDLFAQLDGWRGERGHQGALSGTTESNHAK